MGWLSITTIPGLMIFAFGAHAASSASSCVKPDLDYRAYYSTEAQVPLLKQEVMIDGRKDAEKAWFITDRRSCGSEGCEYAVYARTGPPGCFTRVAEFQGEFQILGTPEKGRRMIEVRAKTRGESTETIARLAFEPISGRYHAVAQSIEPRKRR